MKCQQDINTILTICTYNKILPKQQIYMCTPNEQCVPKQQARKYESYLLTLKNAPRHSTLPPNLKVLLKTDYPLVCRVLCGHYNFKAFTKEDESQHVNLIWTDNYVSEQYVKRLLPHQRVNHFPASAQLGRKDRLAHNLNLMRTLYPHDYDFYPKTFVLPLDYPRFATESLPCYYIAKPYANCQGRGIYIATNKGLTGKEHSVVQEYLTHPLLLNECKFDLRLYVLLSNLNPLKIHLYKEGLSRFATKKYQPPSQANIKRECMHLTNYAINKNSPDFLKNTDINADYVGHKRSFTAIIESLKQMHVDTDILIQNIKDIIVKTILSCLGKLLASYKNARKDIKVPVCFQIFGFDIIIGSDHKPYLLEVNHEPSFLADSPLDLVIKRSMLLDAVQLIDFGQKQQQQHLSPHNAFQCIYPVNNVFYQRIVKGIYTPQQPKHIRKKIHFTDRKQKLKIIPKYVAPTNYTIMHQLQSFQQKDNKMTPTFYRMFRHQKYNLTTDRKEQRVQQNHASSLNRQSQSQHKLKLPPKTIEPQSAVKTYTPIAIDRLFTSVDYEHTTNMHKLSRLYVRKQLTTRSHSRSISEESNRNTLHMKLKAMSALKYARSNLQKMQNNVPSISIQEY